ncbi:MAG: hypothetical protein AAFV07_07055 [Bacteroidota bacterium]
MKPAQLLAALGAAMVLCMLFACGEGNNPQPTPGPSFSCLIDGVPFTGTTITSSVISTQNNASGDFGKRYDIQATNADGDTTLNLVFGEEPTDNTGSFCLPLNVPIVQDTNLFAGSTSAFMTIKVGNLIDGFPFDGQVTLTECDDTDNMIEGTFSLRSESLANDSVVFNFTNGVFKDIQVTVIQ